MKKGFFVAVAFTLLLSLTACSQPADSNSLSGGASESSPVSEDIGEDYITEYQEKTELFSLPLNANGKTYSCDVYMYHRYYTELGDGETSINPDYISGDIAIDLTLDGKVLDRKMLKPVGQNGTMLEKAAPEKLCSVIPMKQDVVQFVFNNGGMLNGELLTVTDGDKLVWIERSFTEEELSERDVITTLEKIYFNISEEYTFSDNSIIYKYDNDNISVEIDFDSYTVKCEKEEHKLQFFYQ